MKNQIKQIAIIGATASGKSALAVKVAEQFDAIILSLDSLSIYKEIDIVSAKPTIEERGGIEHCGIDVIYPNESFDVTTFIGLYQKAYQKATQLEKNLIIVGGTGFYLKSLIDGISPFPTISPQLKEKIKTAIHNLPKIYDMLYQLDPQHMQNIAQADSYRIEKALTIFWSTGLTPTQYFRENPAQTIIKHPLPIYSIETPRELLRTRIAQRTQNMIENGLIDEIATLEKKYTRKPNAMKAIGIKETLDYLDGRYTLDMLHTKITTNTARLAKRQSTFNRSQFSDTTAMDLESLEERIGEDLNFS